MVSTLIITVVGVSLIGVIGGAIGARKLMALRNGENSSSTGSGVSSARRRQSKGARGSDERE